MVAAVTGAALHASYALLQQAQQTNPQINTDKPNNSAPFKYSDTKRSQDVLFGFSAL